MYENREISGASRPEQDRDRPAKAQSHKAGMHAPEKSDRAAVPMNQPNKGDSIPAEVGEGRVRTKENIVPSHTSPTQSGERVSQGLSGVRQAARERKQGRFTALLHHLTVGLLRDSFYALKRQAAPGVDGVTWKEYETGLEGRIVDLHSRVHRGAYQAQPSRRVYIPKSDGRQRPLGIAALEDKIVQQAVVTILNEIYEVDFKGFSYGFRPGRNPHQALDALAVGIQMKRVNWVLDADIRGFFDNLSHEWAIKFVEHRVADRRILRLIQKWLKAGVSEDGQWSESKVGTPQGAVVSPLLANVYLHYVFDLWIEAWRRKVAVGELIAVRYADDLVVGFESRTEAERFLGEFRERLAKFGLELHAEKTRLIEFGEHAERVRKQRGEGKPETFTFLGFTHYCGKRRSDGSFIVWRKTASKRMVAKLRSLKAELIRRKHEPIAQVGEWLRRATQGYYQYHAVPGNLNQLSAFRHRLCRLWRSILDRRSQRGERPWQRLTALLERWIPFPRVLHPYPQARFAARHSR
jgi:group II intron reverse transcriptase/maturase